MNEWVLALPLGAALAANLLITPLVRRLGLRLGRVASPRLDRWHTQPTPTLGGVGIFAAFVLSLLLGHLTAPGGLPPAWSFLGGSILVFLAGLWDEFRPLSPAAKLVAQILCGETPDVDVAGLSAGRF